MTTNPPLAEVDLHLVVGGFGTADMFSLMSMMMNNSSGYGYGSPYYSNWNGWNNWNSWGNNWNNNWNWNNSWNNGWNNNWNTRNWNNNNNNNWALNRGLSNSG